MLGLADRTRIIDLFESLMKGDVAAALEWYGKAAEQGMPEAQTALGDAYASGTGVPADTEAAAGWYEKAAAQGHPPAQAKLAGLRGPRLVAQAEPLQIRMGW